MTKGPTDLCAFSLSRVSWAKCITKTQCNSISGKREALRKAKNTEPQLTMGSRSSPRVRLYTSDIFCSIRRYIFYENSIYEMPLKIMEFKKHRLREVTLAPSIPGSSSIKVSIQELPLPLQSIGICCISTMCQALFLGLHALVTNEKSKHISPIPIKSQC